MSLQQINTKNTNYYNVFSNFAKNFDKLNEAVNLNENIKKYFGTRNLTNNTGFGDDNVCEKFFEALLDFICNINHWGIAFNTNAYDYLTASSMARDTDNVIRYGTYAYKSKKDQKLC